MKSFILVLGLVASALAASRTSPPAGCITVAKSGGNFNTIQAAVNSLSTTASGKQCIFIQPGTYREQVLVNARTAQLTIYGYTTDDKTYAANGATIISNKSQKDGLNNDQTATLRVKAKGFRLYNVNVVNDYGEGSQAVALSAYADSGYYGNSFEGFQDTVLSNEGNQVYVENEIIGATDFIFGQRARSWFERNDIRVVAKSLGYITANGRDSNDNAGSYYAFNNCDVAGVSGQNVPAGAYYLGRPWRPYARVVFQKTTMSAVVNKAGWRDWSTSGAPPSTVYYGEYANSGAGSVPASRPSTIKKLSAAVTIQEVLGSSYASQTYFDQAYFSG
ncbi:pectinesterase [Paramyrothecium foliicola]|nr:pectinesterase [Paramyrothecium foliicola]